METPIATNSLVMGSLPARHARYRPHHTAVVVVPRGQDEHEIRLDVARVRCLHKSLRECAGGAWRRPRRPRRDGAREFARTPRNVLGVRQARRGLGSAVAAADRDRARVAPRRCVTARRHRVRRSHCARWTRRAARRRNMPRRYGRCSMRPPTTRRPATGPSACCSARRARPTREVRVEAGDLWTLMYTSGTTGAPKGIQHTHFIRAMYGARSSSWRMAPESVVLHSGSIVFNGAMTTMLPAFMLGATFVLERSFDAEAFIATVERERVTHTMLVPSQIIAILNAQALRSGAPRVARDDSFAGRSAAPGKQGPPESPAAATFLRTLRVDRGLSHRARSRRRGAQVRERRRPAALLRHADRRRRRPRSAGRIDRRNRRPRPDHDARLLQPARRDRSRRCATAGSIPAISAMSTRTASSISSIARKT